MDFRVRTEVPSLRYLPALLWAMYVLVASLIDPGSSSAPTTGPFGVVGFDKWLHIATYATFAVLLAVGIWAGTSRQMVIVCLVTVGFGASIEALQYPIAARSADILDVLANTVGATIGIMLWTAVRRGGRTLSSSPTNG